MRIDPNALIITAVNWNAPAISGLNAPEETEAPEHAMAVQNFSPADSINMSISPKQLTESTGIRLPIQEPV